MKYLLTFLFTIGFLYGNSQVYPTWGPEISVDVIGFSQDAMEPHISSDGNAMFFNNLNDAITTEMSFAGKINDSTFSFISLVPIVNQTVTPRLDAVASIDTADNFYWVSTRDYPAEFDNLFRIRFLTPGYTNFGRVHGNFYIYQPGWLIMDAAISYTGEELYYCNAFFDTCGIPCNAKLGIAKKVNDSTFNKIANSDYYLSNINQDTTGYIIYAPCISNDGLELYFTRAPHGTLNTEICVSVRTDTSSVFSLPMIIEASPGLTPEAPTLTLDKNIIYYHKKSGGVYKLYMRYRTSWADMDSYDDKNGFNIFPNPANNQCTITLNQNINENILTVFSITGELITQLIIPEESVEIILNTENFSPGIYLIGLGNVFEKLIIE